MDELENRDVAFAVVLSLCVVVGVPGNVAVMVYLRRNNQLSSLSRGLMMNLAVSDLLCLLSLPLLIHDTLHMWEVDETLCKATFFLLFCSVVSSLLNVTALSLQRCLQVAVPQRISRLGLAGQRALLAAIWVCAAGFASPYAVAALVGRGMGRNTCVIDWKFYNFYKPWIEVIVGFVVPFVVMSFSYLLLHRRANQLGLCNSPRMTRLITSIIVTFVLLWTPYQIVNILGIAGHSLENDSLIEFYFQYSPVFGASTMLNSTVNPFLYAFASRKSQTETNESHLMEEITCVEDVVQEREQVVQRLSD